MAHVIHIKPDKKTLLQRCVIDELTIPLGFKLGSLALHFAGYKKIEDILRADPADLLQVPHIGKRKLSLIQDYLAAHGLVYPHQPDSGCVVVQFRKPAA
jgi:hypothetical protein